MTEGSVAVSHDTQQGQDEEGNKNVPQLPSEVEPAGVPSAATLGILGVPPAATGDKDVKKEDDSANISIGTDIKSIESTKPSEPLTRATYRIPSYAGWFSWGKIHLIEQRALPEFFDRKSLSSTPKVYKEYRDFIINKYRENPGRTLTFTEVRRMLVGDVNLVRKVFDCMEYWGLINHHLAPESKQQGVMVERGPTSESIPPGARTYYPCKPVFRSKASNCVVSPSSMASYRDNFAKPHNIVVTDVVLDEVADKGLMTSCSSCGSNCSEQHFENKNKEGFILCGGCFSAGDGFLKDDFILKEPKSMSELPSNEWTKEELLRLLEAIAKHGEDWDRVALHVETRSTAECIMQFLKLPFGDQFLFSNTGASQPDSMSFSQSAVDNLEKTMNIEQKESSNGACGQDLQDSDELLESVEDGDGPPPKRPHLATLGDSSNPILAQVAFLSAMAGPRVAAAAAQAALVALAEEDPVAAQFMSPAHLFSTQPGHKDPLHTSSSRVASKENAKAEEKQKEGALSVKEEPIQLPTETTASKAQSLSVTQIRAGISTAIGVVAANAKLLADQEEREMEYLMATIIENQLKKLDSKVRHFNELEVLLEAEHAQLERSQAQVLADCIRYSNYNYSTGPT